MTFSESLLSLNQTQTYLVHYDATKNASCFRYISLLDNTVTSCKINLSNIQQIEPYYHSNILFVRTLSGLSVWNVTNSKIVMEDPIQDLREILVSKKYIATCTSSEIRLLYASTLTLFQSFSIQSFHVGSCALEYIGTRTVFSFSASRGTCTICRENTLVTISVFQSDILTIRLHSAYDIIIIACAEKIKILRLSSLDLIRQIENKVNQIHVSSLSKNMCFCSNNQGKTQCISLQEDKSDIFIDHAAGFYIHSHGMLRNISKDGFVIRRIRVE